MAIVAAYYHSLALKQDGTVVSWGDSYGHVGAVPAGLSNLVAIAAGDYHSVALKTDGTVIAWGNSYGGRTNVPAGLTNVVAITAGADMSIALKRDGTMVGWGNVGSDLSTYSNVVAVSAGLYLLADGTVPGIGFTNCVAVDAGQYVSTVLRGDGTVIQNDVNGIAIVPDLTNAIAVSSGRSSSLAIISDGRPAITLQPISRIPLTASSATLRVMAVGAGPLFYQWRFNATNLPGATNAVLVLAAVHPSDAGVYSVVVSNYLGAVTSSNAVLSIFPGAPVLTAQPSSQSVYRSGTGILQAPVYGTWPFSYQWRLGGVDIAGATNASLILSNIAVAQAGLYSVVISNAAGVITSSNAAVSVIQVVGWGWGVGFNGTWVPALSNEVVAVSAGNYETLALNKDGTVTAWRNSGANSTIESRTIE